MVVAPERLETFGDDCCQPGDFTVTKVPSGYLIGHAVQQLGPGPWWEYIAVVEKRRDAFDQAVRLAHEVGTRAWLVGPGSTYSSLS